MKCPDCSNDMKKHGAFYICGRCGLSLKPWEIEEAHKRARKEIDDLKGKNEEEAGRRKRRERLKYRDWLEGRQERDYD